MKRIIILFTTIAFIALAGNCNIAGLFDSSRGGSNQPPTPTVYSEGTPSSPISLTYYTIHSGSVDGTNSSFYAYYSSVLSFYYFYLINLTTDSDLYCYNGDGSFSTLSMNSGTTNEVCTSNQISGAVYVEVAPFDANGSFFDIYVY